MIEVKYVWMDGKFVKWKNAKVHILTHCLHYGSGVFEGIRCYETIKGPAIFRHIDHLKRMENSAKLIGMKIPFTIEEIRRATKELIRRNKIKSCYIRPICYYSYGEMGLEPRSPVSVAVIVWPWGKYLGKEKVAAKISSWRRIDRRTVPTNAKVCGYYINSILAHNEAKNLGYDEAILLNIDGYVAEGPGENIFIVKNKVLITPPISAGILPGITRDSVLKIAKDLKIKAIEKNITKKELLSADEVFFTGTAAEITAIEKIDNTEFKKFEITNKIKDKFYEIVRGEDEKYYHWLDFVE